MDIIQVNGFAFRIPGIPARYRANCSKDYGLFVHGETKNMSSIEVNKAGLTKGNFVDLALCWVDQKTLTFEPNYIDEPFTEIWGLPVGGEMKTQFAEKASELSTFLMHRQSKDKLSGMIETFSKDAFNEWVMAGMEGDPLEFAMNKASEAYFTRIFRFEFKKVESGKYGAYFYLDVSYREPAGDLELAALEAGRQIYQNQLTGGGWCTDQRLLANQARSFNAIAGSDDAEPVALPEAGNGSKEKTKQLRGSK